ncbi:MAG: hypothetical protein IKW74_07035, partial [Thermoguttaceae bacterium]|nr:hypothetical protein [Thermoguttaceae bacterium]
LVFSGVFYWFGEGVKNPVLKTTGFLLLLAAFSGLASCLLDDSPGVLIGPGGYTGCIIQLLLSHLFPSLLGCYIFLGNIFLAGIILVSDFRLIYGFLWITGIYQMTEAFFTPCQSLFQSVLGIKLHPRVVKTPKNKRTESSDNRISDVTTVKSPQKLPVDHQENAEKISNQSLADPEIVQQQHLVSDEKTPSPDTLITADSRDTSIKAVDMLSEKEAFLIEETSTFALSGSEAAISPQDSPIIPETSQNIGISPEISAMDQFEEPNPPMVEQQETLDDPVINENIITETKQDEFPSHWEHIPCEEVPETGDSELDSDIISEFGDSEPDSDTISEMEDSEPDSDSISEFGDSEPDSDTISEMEDSEPDSDSISEMEDSEPDSDTISEMEDSEPDLDSISDTTDSSELISDPIAMTSKNRPDNLTTTDTLPVEPQFIASLQDSDEITSSELTTSDSSPTHLSTTDSIKTIPSSKPAYQFPPIELLKERDIYDMTAINERIIQRGEFLEQVFKSYGLNIKVVDIQTGPVLTLYEIELAQGLRVKSVRALNNDLEIAMKVPSVRIVSPIPGKNTVGVEMPNVDRQLVRLREVMEESVNLTANMQIPLYIGKDVAGDPLVVDLTKLPHLLIAGRTGTGKSVCLNAIIMSILMTRTPEEVRLILIDPKMVELSPYKTIPHLMHPVVFDLKKAEAILEWAVEKMEQRYQIFTRAGARKLSEFNNMSLETLKQRVKPESDEEWAAFPKKMPYIVIVADEMADLIMTSGKDVERHIIRLAQKSRAVGIHLVLATQKPTVDIITGLIKSNLPARIAFGVASRTDSQVVLDCKGAEQLLGNGDMLFLLPGTSQVIRGQGTFVSDTEIDSVINAISTDTPDFEIVLTDTPEESDEMENKTGGPRRDELYDTFVETVLQQGWATTSSLQRKFSVGYPRAARIVDMMTEDGIISPADPLKPSKKRVALITYTQWLNRKNGESTSISNSDPAAFNRVTATPVPKPETFPATSTIPKSGSGTAQYQAESIPFIEISELSENEGTKTTSIHSTQTFSSNRIRLNEDSEEEEDETDFRNDSDIDPENETDGFDDESDDNEFDRESKRQGVWSQEQWDRYLDDDGDDRDFPSVPAPHNSLRDNAKKRREKKRKKRHR